jgi:protein involved in polysaccharide export with SLBB domain
MIMRRVSQRTNRTRAVSTWAVVWLLAGASAWAGQNYLPKRDGNGASQQQSAPVLLKRPRYQIQPGDVLVLSFPISPTFNRTVTVAPDGYVSLDDVGDVYVAGKSLPGVRKTLHTVYAKILNDPIVNVDLKSFQKPYYMVSGQVGRPGKFDLLGQKVTVVEALAMAGGETANAKTSQVLLFRHVPGGAMVEVRKLNLKKMLKKGNLQEDPVLQVGDLVYVPQNTISKIARFLPTSSLGLYTQPVIP